MYDSRDVNEPKESRVIVFATRRNLKELSSSSMWFLDGTLKVRKIFVKNLFSSVQKIKAAPKKKWIEMQTRLRRVVLNYET